MHMHTTINFPAMGEIPVVVDPYVPNTIDLQDGTTRPYGVRVNGTAFVSPTTFNSLKDGNLDLVVQDLGTISLEPSSFDFDVPFDLLPSQRRALAQGKPATYCGCTKYGDIHAQHPFDQTRSSSSSQTDSIPTRSSLEQQKNNCDPKRAE